MKNNKRYFLLITLGVIFVFAFNLLFYFSFESILFCLISFAIVVAPCAVVIFMIRFFPERWFNPNRKIFHVFNFESKLYESINIRKWKNKLPEPGKALFRFDKSKVKNPKDPEYLMLFLYENCRGSSSHFFCFLWGFLCLPVIAIILPHPFQLTAGLLIACLHGIIHLASLITLRYMRPRLMKLYDMNKEHAQKTATANAEADMNNKVASKDKIQNTTKRQAKNDEQSNQKVETQNSNDAKKATNATKKLKNTAKIGKKTQKTA